MPSREFRHALIASRPSGKRAEILFEPARSDVNQPARTVRSNPKGMGQLPRKKARLPGTEREGGEAAIYDQLAFKYEEQFVFTAMNMERWLNSGRGIDLKQGESASGVVRIGVKDYPSADRFQHAWRVQESVVRT